MYTILSLENGLRIVYEKIPHVRSVAVGVWVGIGSQNEMLSNNGISHFIEHMLFKGTPSRSAKEIAETIDNIGGQINAFTGKECTCYYTKTLDSHIHIAIDLLADIFLNSNFDQKDIDIEKRVILEEINMYEDTPEELVHDLLTETVWDKNPLGYSILGTPDSLAKIDRTVMMTYVNEKYTPYNTVISIAGNFDEQNLISLLTQSFGVWKKPNSPVLANKPIEFQVNDLFKEKETEQIHACIGFEGIPYGSDELYTLSAINHVIGGGMSSHLFQKIREEHGLVYSIYSYPSSYNHAGIFSIYAGMNPDCLEKVYTLIANELSVFKRNGMSADELSRTKEQLKGSFILALEGTSSRMNGIGKSLLLLDKIYQPEEILQKIEAISLDETNELISRIFDFSRVSTALIGKFQNKLPFSRYVQSST